MTDSGECEWVPDGAIHNSWARNPHIISHGQWQHDVLRLQASYSLIELHRIDGWEFPAPFVQPVVIFFPGSNPCFPANSPPLRPFPAWPVILVIFFTRYTLFSLAIDHIPMEAVWPWPFGTTLPRDTTTCCSITRQQESPATARGIFHRKALFNWCARVESEPRGNHIWMSEKIVRGDGVFFALSNKTEHIE